MRKNHHKAGGYRTVYQMLTIGVFLFTSNPGYAGNYGHHYGHGYRHYGHHGHFSYNHHGHGSHLGYVLLGLTGVVLLAHLLNHDRYSEKRYYTPYAYQPPVSHRTPAQRVTLPAKRISPGYGVNEGWDRLSRGDTGQAANIFAVQSQQQVNSGIPKIGFALAISMNGEPVRGTRSMRRALRVDADALRFIDINKDMEIKLDLLSEVFQSRIDKNGVNTDDVFMLAALSYLQRDYVNANSAISAAMASGDQDPSTINLQALIDSKNNR